jgi:hypothetical protein
MDPLGEAIWFCLTAIAEGLMIWGFAVYLRWVDPRGLRLSLRRRTRDSSVSH